MPKPYTILLGKTVRYIARLRGGGSALPGLFVERIDPQFVAETLAQLPQGVVLISGTNGKTTTTKMVVQLLESQGMKVFTNRTGSNFVRGVAAALLGEVDSHGKIDADIAVLELDEAHAVHFVDQIKPRHSLLLNVMRDQLDRFGEIDATARMLEHIAKATTDSVTLNREDPRVAAIAEKIETASVNYFGLGQALRTQFPSDDDMHGISQKLTTPPDADVTLSSFKDDIATFTIDGKHITTPLKLQGIYNIYNAAAALALVRSISSDIDEPVLISTLAAITPAFGRGEALVVNGHPLELVLVKNPSGFRLGLQSFSPDGYATMIAINDNYADGRDMSWLWDVDFDSLREAGVSELSGSRAYDMALRMQYDEVTVSHVETNLSTALRHFIAANPTIPKRIYCTYTAMMTLRRELAKITDVEVIS
ncbi:Mur ligase [Candidatus Saccharibacteria bacterium RIFCSPHIGHO2_02_FULL_46_12]|nr:MAG: Mur ligase [Candidatus Saccharibacteria bacterium RIFCSPHIGHO2_02_FULL_46_12]